MFELTDSVVKTAQNELTIALTNVCEVNVEVNMSIVNHGSGKLKSLKLVSNNLALEMLPKMFKTLHVECFNGGFSDDGYYWMLLNYKYKHFDDGSNSSSIATVFLNQDGSIFKFVDKLNANA